MPDINTWRKVLSDEIEPKAKSLTSAAFEVLRADIIACRLKPNEKLRIQRLCVRYKVGATALREALSRLVAEGLVEAKDQRGFYVAPVSRADLLDVTQARIQIEGLALRESIRIGDPAWEAEVIGAFHRLSRARVDDGSQESYSSEQWSRLHQEFHAALISGCGSNWMRLFCKVLFEQSERYRNLIGRTELGKKRDVCSEHRGLMDAVLARKADLACQGLSEHFLTTTCLLLESYKGKDASIFKDARRGRSGKHQKRLARNETERSKPSASGK